MSQPFFVLLLLLISLFATDVVHSQTALTTRSLPYCGVSKDKCSRIIELIDLKRDRFVVSFVTGSRSKPTSADSRTYLDSLVGFATKSGAVGVFSAGFYRDPWIALPFGGFKVNGVLISKVLDYPESSFICEAKHVCSRCRTRRRECRSGARNRRRCRRCRDIPAHARRSTHRRRLRAPQQQCAR